MGLCNKLKGKWSGIPLTVKASVAYTVCSILQRSLSFITMPLFTRLLTPDQYGQYTVYNSWIGIFSILLTLNLAYGSFSTAMVKFERQRERYISSIQGLCLLLSVGFLVIYLPLQGPINGLLGMPTLLVLLLVAEITTSNATLLWSGKQRFEYKYKSVVVVTLFVSACSPVLAYLLVSATEDKGTARILGYTLVTVVVGCVIFVWNTVKGKALYDKSFWQYALRFNVPLLAYYLSQVVFNQSDRIMIDHICGTAAAAMYGVAYNLAMLLNFVLNAINGSYVPWYYGKLKEGKQEENRAVSASLAILMGLMLLCVIWYAPEIIRLMAGEAYEAAIPAVAPVAMSVLLLFYAQFFINVEFYFEEKRSLVWASIGAAVLNIVLNAWLIPLVGFVAAAYTTLASYVVFAGCNYIAMKKLLRRREIPEAGYNMKLLLLIMVLFMASGFLGMALYPWILPRIIITLLVLGLLLVFHKPMLQTLKTIKK